MSDLAHWAIRAWENDSGWLGNSRKVAAMKHEAVGALGVLVAIMMLGGACTSDDEPKKELAGSSALSAGCRRAGGRLK